MASPRIIAISGPSGAGKDTVAYHLVHHYGYTRIGMSDALKVEVKTRLRRTLLAHIQEAHPGLPDFAALGEDDLLNHYLWNVRCPTTRALLQEYGSEVRRADNPNYWTIKWVQAYMACPTPVVVPDMRFPNEVAIIDVWGGIRIKITRPGLVLPESVGSHQSETSLPNDVVWDVELVNDRDIPALTAQVDAMMASHPAIRNWEPIYRVLSGRST